MDSTAVLENASASSPEVALEQVLSAHFDAATKAGDFFLDVSSAVLATSVFGNRARKMHHAASGRLLRRLMTPNDVQITSSHWRSMMVIRYVLPRPAA